MPIVSAPHTITKVFELLFAILYPTAPLEAKFSTPRIYINLAILSLNFRMDCPHDIYAPGVFDASIPAPLGSV